MYICIHNIISTPLPSPAQAAAAGQAGARLISPFTGRILDWHKVDKKQEVSP